MMAISTDSLIVISIVTVAAAFILRRVWRSIRSARNASASCGAECGCSTASAAPIVPSTTHRTRR